MDRDRVNDFEDLHGRLELEDPDVGDGDGLPGACRTCGEPLEPGCRWICWDCEWMVEREVEARRSVEWTPQRIVERYREVGV